MLLLCGGRGEGEGINYSRYKLKYPFKGTKKSVIKQKIQTVRENMIELLQKAEREKEVAEREKEVAERKLQENKRNQERTDRKHAREINERERRIAILEAQAKVWYLL